MKLLHEFYLEDELKSDYEETIGRDVDNGPVQKIKRWKSALENGTTDPMFQDIEAMQDYGLTWEQLMALPERVYLSMERIKGLKAKHALQKQAEAEAEAQYGNRQWE